MQPDLNRVIEEVSKEKGIDKEIIIAALEAAMLSAARRTFGFDHQLEAKFNPDIGEVEVFEIKTVVDEVTDPANQVTVEVAQEILDPYAAPGDELLSKLSQEKFGRIAAQAAEQNNIQRVCESERTIVFNEFKDREGELFSGIVQSFEGKNIIVNLGHTDAILPVWGQIPRERYHQGDRIRAYILDVELTSNGPQMVLSRTHPGLLIKLFEQEVPEISEGVVEVKGAAREPGGGREDRCLFARFGRRSGRRLRRHAGNAGGVGGAGAERGEYRHHSLDSRPGRVRLPGAVASEGLEDHHGRGRARDGGDRPR